MVSALVSSERSGWSRTVEISDRCTACGLCLITCGERALLRAPKRPAVVDDRCTGCGACIEVCPVDAIADVWLNGPESTRAWAGR